MVRFPLKFTDPLSILIYASVVAADAHAYVTLLLNVIEDALAPSHRNILLCVPLLLLVIDVVPVTVNVPVLEIYISAVPVPVAELLIVRLPLIVAVALAPFTRYITFAAPEALLFILRSAPKVFDAELLAK